MRSKAAAQMRCRDARKRPVRSDSLWSPVRIRHDARKRPHGNHSCGRGICRLDFRLLGDLQRVINLDAEVADGTLQLGVPQQQLNRP